MMIPPIKWRPRHTPLVPKGLLVRAEQKGLLLKRLVSLSDSQLSKLRGSYNDDVVVIVAANDDLPWVPEGTYLGKDQHAKHLWLPTNLAPDISPDVLDGAICYVHGDGQYVVNPWDKEIYNVSNLLTLSSEQIRVLEQ